MYIFFYIIGGVLLFALIYFFYITEIRRYIYLKQGHITTEANVVKVQLDPNSDNYDVLLTLSFTTVDHQKITTEYYVSQPTQVIKGRHISPEEYHRSHPTMTILYNAQKPHLFKLAKDIKHVRKSVWNIGFMILAAFVFIILYLKILLDYIMKNVY